MERALELRRRELGEEHPDTLSTMSNLAALYRDQANYAKAEPLAIETLDLRRRTLGDDHPNTIVSMHGLVELYQLQGKYSDAEPACFLLLQARRRKLAPQHPQLAHALVLLASNHLQQLTFAEAEPLLREALQIRRGTIPDDWRTFQTVSLLGASLAGQGQLSDAEPLLLSGYEGISTRASEIPAHVRTPRITQAIHRLINLYDRWDKPEQVSVWQTKLNNAESKQNTDRPRDDRNK